MKSLVVSPCSHWTGGPTILKMASVINSCPWWVLACDLTLGDDVDSISKLASVFTDLVLLIDRVVLVRSAIEDEVDETPRC